MKYIFTSKHLGFRTWKDNDIDNLTKLCSNEEVMRFFPSILNRKQCNEFLNRMQNQFKDRQICYFAVELLETKEFIGFIGLSHQTYETDFNPSIDIGWRILPKFWGKGYATEGAKASLEYGFSIGISKIIAVAPIINFPSIRVMQKIGMVKDKEFSHPLLNAYPKIQECVLYRIKKSET